MAVRLKALADLVGGELMGDPDVLVSGAATLADAQSGDITLVDHTEKAGELARTGAAAAVVPKGFTSDRLSVIAVDDVHQAFAAIVSSFRPSWPTHRAGVSSGAVVSRSARLAADVDVHSGATIGDGVEIGSGCTIHAGVNIMSGCQLGESVTIYPNAVLYENTIVGPRCVVHAGAVLGSFGFGYKFVDGRHRLSAQLGNVQLGADVEVGAGTTIDRGTYGPTLIGEGTKIDNLVMIAHNCRIGRHNMICSQVGIAGSTTTGDYVVMAGQVGVRDHVHIGTRAVLGAMAGVTHDVPDGICMIGIPATPEREQKIKQAALAKLPEMRHQLKALQKVVDSLTRPNDGERQTEIVRPSEAGMGNGSH